MSTVTTFPAGRAATGAHWGAAGQRLTTEQVEERARARQADAHRARAAQEAADAAAYAQWRAGKVSPGRITLILNARALYGPQVDEACGVSEPAVDEWETGERYPTWAQLQALAALCEVHVGFFEHRAALPTGPLFLCFRSHPSKSQVVTPGPYLEYATPQAIARALAEHDDPTLQDPTPEGLLW